MLINLRYYSNAIGMNASLCAVVPQRPGPLPAIYQLHGLSDDESIWQRRTTIELHAERIGAILVMPFGARSFYVDRADGQGAWERHILDTVALVDQTFRTIPDRSARAIGGLSMGGYGAMKLGLKHAKLFGSVASHSGALDIGAWISSQQGTEWAGVFGARLKPGEDVFKLALAKRPRQSLYLDCGCDDFLIQHNRDFHAHLDRHRIAHTYAEHPGAHTWEYWEAHVGAAFDHHAAWFKARK